MPTATKARRRTLAEKVEPRNTALVVVDMQNDFCHADGYFGKRGGDLSAVGPAVAKIEALVAEARRLDMLILWVRAPTTTSIRARPWPTPSSGAAAARNASWRARGAPIG